MTPMLGGYLRRLGAAVVVVALLLAGFGMSSGVAGSPCDMRMPSMAMAMDGPCGDEGAPDGPEKAPSGVACFANCPAPVLDRAGAPAAPLALLQAPLFGSHPAVLAGIGVAPLLDPPRV